MKTLIYSAATTALLTVIVGFAPAQATMPALNLKSYTGSSVTPVHCEDVRHCHWTIQGGKRTKRCHVCGPFRD